MTKMPEHWGGGGSSATQRFGVLRIFGRRSGGGQRQYCPVGLVIPHLARLLVGVDHRRLLPCAFWLGAVL